MHFAYCKIPTLSIQSLPLKVVWKWFNLQLGSMMAQNNRVGEYILFTSAQFCLNSDSSDSDSYSDGDSYSGWLWFNLWLGSVMAQNDRAGEYINSK